MKIYSFVRDVTLCFLLSIALSPLSWGADFQKGSTAAQNGDFATALREWTPLAEQGDASAQYNLGVLYYQGNGVPQDYKTAVKWFARAAEQGDADAQYNTGYMYHIGKGVPQDYKEAVKWYTSAAKQGHADAQNNLADMYATGQGVLQDDVYAHMWWNIAAFNGAGPASENRNWVGERMTPEQISEAQKLARECVAKNYKGC